MIKNINKLEKDSFERGTMYGKHIILNHFKTNALNSLDEEYTSLNNVSIIKMCDKEIEKIRKELNKLKLNTMEDKHGKGKKFA